MRSFAAPIRLRGMRVALNQGVRRLISLPFVE
jgi:hypothetical protein